MLTSYPGQLCFPVDNIMMIYDILFDIVALQRNEVVTVQVYLLIYVRAPNITDKHPLINHSKNIFKIYIPAIYNIYIYIM